MAAETIQNAEKIDWLEIIPENYMNLGGAAHARLNTVAECFPLVSHGVNLSIGSTDPLNEEYLSGLKQLVERADAPWFSDHLCFTSVGGVYMHDLLPLPCTREAVEHVSARIKHVQNYVGRPFLLENISFYMHMPGDEMTEAEFLSEILEKADCGLLLDVNNLYVNSRNHSFDAVDYLKRIPLERVVQIHMAGHSHVDDNVIDTHGAAVVDAVYDLLGEVLRRTRVHAVMLERDQHFPPFTEIIGELDRFREIASVAQPALANVKRDIKAVDVASSAQVFAPTKGRERAGALSA
jgi:hypothetical protein